MRTLANIIWFLLGGWWTALGYLLLGVLLCITIVGIPIGKALFQYAKLMAVPFGKEIIKETELKGAENVSMIRKVGGTIVNIIWLPIGICMFIANIGLIIASFVSIIFIPVGIVLAKSCKFLIWPIGAKVVSREDVIAAKVARKLGGNLNVANVQNAETTQNNGQPQNAAVIQSSVEKPAFTMADLRQLLLGLLILAGIAVAGIFVLWIVDFVLLDADPIGRAFGLIR